MVSAKALLRIQGLIQSDQDLLIEFLDNEGLSSKSEEIYFHAVQGYEKATQ